MTRARFMTRAPRSRPDSLAQLTRLSGRRFAAAGAALILAFGPVGGVLPLHNGAPARVAAAPMAQTAPVLSVSPATAAVGDSVTIDGSGFAPGQTVELHWPDADGPVLANGAADATRIAQRAPAQDPAGAADIRSNPHA